MNPKRVSSHLAPVVERRWEDVVPLLDACERVLDADSENLRRWALESLEKEYRVFRMRSERV